MTAMSRRPSYPSHQDEDISLISSSSSSSDPRAITSTHTGVNGNLLRRTSLISSQVPFDSHTTPSSPGGSGAGAGSGITTGVNGESQRVDWTRTGSATFLPLGFGGDKLGKGGVKTPLLSSYNDRDEAYGMGSVGHDKSRSGHVELNLDGAGAGVVRQRSPIDLSAFRTLQRSRRLWERLAIIALAVTVIVLLLAGKTGGGIQGRSGGYMGGMMKKVKIKGLGPKNPLAKVVPLHSFRANLKEHHGYVTSFPYGGLTNQLIELFKLVHLGQLLNRAAILTELKAVHSEGGDVPVSTFFDLPSFQYYSNISIAEWRDVKQGGVPGTQEEVLSCWGWRDERALERYNVKTWFWPPPNQLTVPSSIETSMTFPAIEVLVSQNNDGWLQETAKRYFGSVENAPPYPDKQLLCFENLFYVPSLKFVEGEVDTTYTIEEMSAEDPVWTRVGQYLRFNDAINHVADELLIALMGSKKKKYVAVHLRQGDFIELGRISSSIIDSFKEGVDKVQEEIIQRRKGKSAYGKVKHNHLPVLFATDSDDPAFIRKLVQLGWIYINHVEFATSARFGGWYPGVLDSVLLSRAAGLVGTKQSTFSYVAARRVEDWNKGVTTIVG